MEYSTNVTRSAEFLQSISFYQGAQGVFYILCKNDTYQSSFKYTHQFPVCWALNHLLETGPDMCLNCRLNGTINNVFVFYCVDCQKKYNYQRGGTGTYMSDDISEEIMWEEFPYMNQVRFMEIGDEDEDGQIVTASVSHYMNIEDDEEYSSEEDNIHFTWSDIKDEHLKIVNLESEDPKEPDQLTDHANASPNSNDDEY
jgi:hypothetical protein